MGTSTLSDVDVSILVLARLRSPYLDACLDAISLASRHTSRSVEIVAGLDDLDSPAADKISLYSELSPVLVPVGSCSTHAERRNACLDRASGEYVAVCDDDDLCTPYRINRQTRLMDATGALLSGQAVKTVRTIEANGELRTEHQPRTLDASDAGGVPVQPAHSSIMFRRGKLRYREKFHYADDLDLVYRAASEGDVAIVATDLVTRRIHPESITQTDYERVQEYALAARLMHKQRRLGYDDGYDSWDPDSPLSSLGVPDAALDIA